MLRILQHVFLLESTIYLPCRLGPQFAADLKYHSLALASHHSALTPQRS